MEFELKLEWLKIGRGVNPHTKHSLPASHTEDYDRVIQMMEMCQDDTIVLDEKEFQSYIRNKWTWEGQFLASNSAYSATARTLSNGD